MPKNKPEMRANDVLEILQLFQEHKIEVIIDGGWSVDALLGIQTRTHEDLDVAVFHKDVPTIRALLAARGFQEVFRDDSWECNFVFGNDQGHLVDFHSCTFDETGQNIFGVAYPYDALQGTGLINSYPVKCIPPDWLVKFHTGYEIDENDYHDVKLLCQHFNIEIPEEFREFVLRDTA